MHLHTASPRESRTAGKNAPVYLPAFAFLVLVLLAATPALSATYYVNYNSGSNSNDGSQSAPWKECPGTVNATGSTSGWKVIPAGSTILFEAGQTWNRPLKIDSNWFAAPANESQRIALRSSSASTRAVFDFSGTSYSYGISIGRNYITVQYFEVRDINGPGEAKGIFNANVSYTKILNNHVENISSSDSLYGYGIIVSNGPPGGAYVETAYNNVVNAETKNISGGTDHSHHNIHHNYIRQDAGFASDRYDHGIVMGGHDHSVHGNIVDIEYVGPGGVIGYAIKFDGLTGGADCYNNKMYNNLVLKAPMGLGVMDCAGPTTVANNTVYLQNAAGTCTSSGCVHGMVLGGGGGGAAPNTTIRNNIFYYPKIESGGSHMIYLPAPGTQANNTITNNLFYYGNSQEKFRVGSTSGLSLSYVQTSGNWNGVNGNVMQNNTIAAPGFVGGQHTVGQLPTGFDSSGVPNAPGLSLTPTSAAVDAGYAMGAPYNVDITGAPRPQGSGWDIGAYEYRASGDAPVSPIQKTPNPPSDIKIDP